VCAGTLRAPTWPVPPPLLLIAMGIPAIAPLLYRTASLSVASRSVGISALVSVYNHYRPPCYRLLVLQQCFRPAICYDAHTLSHARAGADERRSSAGGVLAAEGKPAGRFSVGDRVLARWKGGDFFPGAVTAANADGSYVVQFDDGDLESAEPHAHMVARCHCLSLQYLSIPRTGLLPALLPLRHSRSFPSPSASPSALLSFPLPLPRARGVRDVVEASSGPGWPRAAAAHETEDSLLRKAVHFTGCVAEAATARISPKMM
jgi:hypothetical protein